MPWWWHVIPYLAHTWWILLNFNKFIRTLFWGLQKPRRDLHNLLVISVLRIGPKLITASALDSIAVLPEGKGKGTGIITSVTSSSASNVRVYCCVRWLHVWSSGDRHVLARDWELHRHSTSSAAQVRHKLFTSSTAWLQGLSAASLALSSHESGFS